MYFLSVRHNLFHCYALDVKRKRTEPVSVAALWQIQPRSQGPLNTSLQQSLAQGSTVCPAIVGMISTSGKSQNVIARIGEELAASKSQQSDIAEEEWWYRCGVFPPWSRARLPANEYVVLICSTSDYQKLRVPHTSPDNAFCFFRRSTADRASSALFSAAGM
jgi:hypothetical protein